MMHTGSGIFSQGKSLATAWEPANPHDEALVIATVPKLSGKSTPIFAGGAPPTTAWGSGPLSTQGPFFTVVQAFSDGRSYNASVNSHSGSQHDSSDGSRFACTVSFTTATTGPTIESANAQEHEYYALVGVNGSWISSNAGGLPARGCALYRIPPASLAAAGGPKK